MSGTLPLATTGFVYGIDTDTGMYLTAANTQAIKCGGVNIATISSSGLDATALSIAGTAVPSASSATTFSNKVLDNTNTATLKDTLFTLQDDGDATKQVRFELSGITTGNTRTLSVPDASTTLVGANATQTLTNKSIIASQLTSGVLGSAVGVAATSYAKGTVSSGTYTPLYSDGNFQYYTNNGAHTLAPPANICTIVIECLNGASAGAITTSGFTKVTGDTLTTTNGSKFHFSIINTQNYSSLTVLALQ